MKELLVGNEHEMGRRQVKDAVGENHLVAGIEIIVEPPERAAGVGKHPRAIPGQIPRLVQQQAGVGRHRPERGKLQAHPRKRVRITSAVAPLECFLRHNEGWLRYTLGNRARRCEHKIVSRIENDPRGRAHSSPPVAPGDTLGCPLHQSIYMPQSIIDKVGGGGGRLHP